LGARRSRRCPYRRRLRVHFCFLLFFIVFSFFSGGILWFSFFLWFEFTVTGNLIRTSFFFIIFRLVYFCLILLVISIPGALHSIFIVLFLILLCTSVYRKCSRKQCFSSLGNFFPAPFCYCSAHLFLVPLLFILWGCSPSSSFFFWSFPVFSSFSHDTPNGRVVVLPLCERSKDSWREERGPRAWQPESDDGTFGRRPWGRSRIRDRPSWGW